LLLSFVHMTIEVSSFDNGLSNDLGAVKSGKDFAPPAGIAGGDKGVRTPNINFLRYSAPIAFLALTVGIGILAAPSKGHAENGTAANQDASQGAVPPAASSQPMPVEMPDGDGKAIALASCQICHRLTNLTNAHKSLDDWRATVETMMDRGANVPQDKLETLVQYLAKNFGPKADTPDSGAPAGGGPSSSSTQPQ
jgi:hypothetical protein